jgi:hypothetical protein
LDLRHSPLILFILLEEIASKYPSWQAERKMQNPRSILEKMYHPVFIEQDGEIICNLFRPNNKPVIMDECCTMIAISNTFYGYDPEMRAAIMCLAIVWRYHPKYAKENSVQQINPNAINFFLGKESDNPLGTSFIVIKDLIADQIAKENKK